VIWLLFSIVVIAGLFLLNWRRGRHGESDAVDPSWRRTDERFVDPSTGRSMRVFLDEAGGRHYVADR